MNESRPYAESKQAAIAKFYLARSCYAPSPSDQDKMMDLAALHGAIVRHPEAWAPVLLRLRHITGRPVFGEFIRKL